MVDVGEEDGDSHTVEYLPHCNLETDAGFLLRPNFLVLEERDEDDDGLDDEVDGGDDEGDEDGERILIGADRVAGEEDVDGE